MSDFGYGVCAVILVVAFYAGWCISASKDGEE